MATNFRPFETLLGGFETNLELDSDPRQRAARAMIEAHLIDKKDVAGCFGYVGWPGANLKPKLRVPNARDQYRIYGAFAQAAVAAEVYLGALEPNEGFGLAVWTPKSSGFSGGYLQARATMEKLIAYAAWLLTETPDELLAVTSVAIGCGKLSGDAHLADEELAKFLQEQMREARRLKSPGARPQFLRALRGPLVVETFYGEIPNRCGATAKGKDAPPLPLRDSDGIVRYSLFQQAWTQLFGQMALNHDKLTDARRPGRDPVAKREHQLIESCRIRPQPIPPYCARPYVVGLSLDFAQSRKAYGRNAHRARAVVDQVLTEFSALAANSKSMFISPRYGDGVAAVVAVEAASVMAVKRGPWVQKLRHFVKTANQSLRDSHGLGLRIGLALARDEDAVAPRLAGLDISSCTAVEAFELPVVQEARACHPLAKELGEDDPLQYAAIERALVFEMTNHVNPNGGRPKPRIRLWFADDVRAAARKR